MQTQSQTIRRCRPDEQAKVFQIINAAAERYRGVIPDDRWHDPYMSAGELTRETEAGVEFWGLDGPAGLLGIMGVQCVKEAELIRHAYVAPGEQGRGAGGRLLARAAPTRCWSGLGLRRHGRSAFTSGTALGSSSAKTSHGCFGPIGPCPSARSKRRWSWPGVFGLRRARCSPPPATLPASARASPLTTVESLRRCELGCALSARHRVQTARKFFDQEIHKGADLGRGDSIGMEQDMHRPNV